jgi:protein phosphatase
MSDPVPQIYCPNPACSAPLNPMGERICANCQTPLEYRYLWAVGAAVLQAPSSRQAGWRYAIVAPQVWLDTQPSLPPELPTANLPDEMFPYLHLYPYRLHLPEVHGICTLSSNLDAAEETNEASEAEILLLENAPLDAQGNLYPAIAQAWESATAVRQVYWLWQLLQLWEPLVDQGVSASLLIADNIRVEGWRVRLCQLFMDETILPKTETDLETFPALSLADLSQVWLDWVDRAKPAIAQPLREMCTAMQAEPADWAAISAQLNDLLLHQVAQLPIRLHLAGITDTGPRQEHNEDTCYPLTLDSDLEADQTFPQLAVVCDGIGGHDGGEIASQLAVQSLRLQIQALLAELSESSIPMAPDVVAEQLSAIARVINDLISSQNDAQGREARRRMGTTLVAALQLPQPIPLINPAEPAKPTLGNSHELYLMNIGDSRAYWITPRYCHRLTVDDDVAAREVRMGRLLYREALQRPDAGALTQALGTRDSEFLRPSVQRFILEEDGVLLLCSDGLSDNGWIETDWATTMADFFKGKATLDETAQAWVELANQKNGHDNVSVVLMQCHSSSPLPEVSLPLSTTTEPATEWTEASRQLLPQDEQTEPTASTLEANQEPTAAKSWLNRLLAVVAMMLLLTGIGLTIWSQIHPSSFQSIKQQLLQPKQ